MTEYRTEAKPKYNILSPRQKFSLISKYVHNSIYTTLLNILHDPNDRLYKLFLKNSSNYVKIYQVD